MKESIGAKIARLKNEWTTLEQRIDKGWEWLRDNPDHPDFFEHEDRWIEMLHRFEDVSYELSLLGVTTEPSGAVYYSPGTSKTPFYGQELPPEVSAVTI